MLHIRGMWVWFKLVLDCDGQPLTSVLLWRIWVVLVTTHFLIGVWELQFVTCESSRLLSQSSTVLTEALPFSWRWRFNQVKAKPIYLIDLDTSAQYDRKRKSSWKLFWRKRQKFCNKTWQAWPDRTKRDEKPFTSTIYKREFVPDAFSIRIQRVGQCKYNFGSNIGRF